MVLWVASPHHVVWPQDVRPLRMGQVREHELRHGRWLSYAGLRACSSRVGERVHAVVDHAHIFDVVPPEHVRHPEQESIRTVRRAEPKVVRRGHPERAIDDARLHAAPGGEQREASPHIVQQLSAPAPGLHRLSNDGRKRLGERWRRRRRPADVVCQREARARPS